MKDKYDYKNDDYKYDYCIIGSGPTGLTVASLLSKIGKKCIIIDKNKEIGGCHRVKRVNGLFTEHGPRIYSSSFINTKELLSKLNIQFNEIFTPYNFTMSDIGNYSVKNFSIGEIISFVYSFIKLIINTNYGKNISMETFMKENNFSESTKDYVDRMCRLTDGASSETYSLNKFLQLINQQTLFTIYQPRKPNDKGLFKKWFDKLCELNVDFMMDTFVLSLEGISENKVEHIVVSNNNIISKIKADNFILCVPPKPLKNILKNSLYKNSFGNFNKLTEWVENSSYMNYIPVVFHWNKQSLKNIKLKDVWGFPKTDWGIAFIVLTNYMDFKDDRSELVISTCVTKTDTISTFNNKTANQCEDENELKTEIFRQLKISFPNLPEPTYSILHPGTIRINEKWIESDTAYIEAFKSKFISPFSNITKNLYQVGTQNGNSIYGFTTMESAISNGIIFSNTVENSTKNIIQRKRNIELIFFIRILILILILIFYLKYIKLYK